MARLKEKLQMNWSIILLPLTLYPAVFLHELGHWAMARALGSFTSHVEVGNGALLFKFVAFNDNWRFRLIPTTGLAAIFTSSIWWKNMLIAAAGPLVSMILVPIYWYFFGYAGAVFALVFGGVDLIPFHSKKIKSDGWRIRNAWRKRHQSIAVMRQTTPAAP
jgi:membrane-associated protease RseP (regulator of RpoE activity)